VAFTPLLSHATARPRQVSTSFESQPSRAAGGSRTSPPGPLNATTRRTAIPARPVPSTQSLNQAARRAFSLRLRFTLRDISRGQLWRADIPHQARPTSRGGIAGSVLRTRQSHSSSHSPACAGVHCDPLVTVIPGRGRPRPAVNAGAHTWKACWGQPLASSNLASSATSDQAIHQAGHVFGLGLPGCVVSFAVSFIYAYQYKSSKIR